ncbi:MAG: hypothetical protein ACYCXT_08085 [Acidiferrobacteraceae bacterium]
MDATTIIRVLAAKGVCLGSTPRGTILVIPASGLSAADRALIRGHKPELLAELRKREHVNLVNMASPHNPPARTMHPPAREGHGNIGTHEATEERAAIMEHDGGLKRSEAERIASLSRAFYSHIMAGTGCCYAPHDRYCSEGLKLRDVYYEAAKTAGRLI